MSDEMTTDEAGKKLAEIAKTTAQYSQNWDNFAQICATMLKQAYEAGKAVKEGDK